MHIQFQFQLVQQCIQISTRINILQCTYVHIRLFYIVCIQQGFVDPKCNTNWSLFKEERSYLHVTKYDTFSVISKQKSEMEENTSILLFCFETTPFLSSSTLLDGYGTKPGR